MKRLLFFFIVFLGTLGVVAFAEAQNATLYFTPSSSTVSPEQTFQVSIMVDTKGEQVNAVAAHFSYPQSLLDVVDTRTESGLIEFNKTAAAGVVKIDVGKTPPVLSGVQKIGSVDFRVKTGASGSVSLSFTSESAVLRDSDSQNILSLPGSGTASFPISQATTPSPPPPTPTPTTPPPAATPTSPPGTSPPAGTSPPSGVQGDELQILDVRAEQVGPNSIQIVWNTNKAADAKVDYGKDNAYNFSVLDGDTAQEHSVLLENLESEGTYQFRVRSATAEGEVAFFEALSLEELFGDQEVEIVPQDPAGQADSNGFRINTTSIILFVVLPLVALAVIAFLVFWRMRKRRAAI